MSCLLKVALKKEKNEKTQKEVEMALLALNNIGYQYLSIFIRYNHSFFNKSMRVEEKDVLPPVSSNGPFLNHTSFEFSLPIQDKKYVRA
eukprot:MONOS_4966.1-p1 / transcript=MONOS_4966.1 / gene=MONOS_4966 / organism=Monocercomonoides_exilis_PA203 / gene_product=unspecified product / transcript_product=unspecified product / location=Mono_scaffold00139:54373-54763(-) / protein_length=89 / sequence_SO=supercontig / SO=protein_coding / is_pseudo=false